jgi:hypothetical protein
VVAVGLALARVPVGNARRDSLLGSPSASWAITSGSIADTGTCK